MKKKFGNWDFGFEDGQEMRNGGVTQGLRAKAERLKG
jgi:hypothetical protein